MGKTILKMAVVGAGTMGAAIAACGARAGLDVVADLPEIPDAIRSFPTGIQDKYLSRLRKSCEDYCVDIRCINLIVGLLAPGPCNYPDQDRLSRPKMSLDVLHCGICVLKVGHPIAVDAILGQDCLCSPGGYRKSLRSADSPQLMVVKGDRHDRRVFEG